MHLLLNYNFAIFQRILCKIYDASLQEQAVNMDLLCILCIANSSYGVKTPKDEVICDTYWNFCKKLKIWTCFTQNGRFRDQTGRRETTSQNGRLPFKTGGLEHKSLNLKELQNCIPRITCVQSLFCSKRVDRGLHFLPILLENQHFVSMNFLCFLPVLCQI